MMFAKRSIYFGYIALKILFSAAPALFSMQLCRMLAPKLDNGTVKAALVLGR
jgi:hypothetical protein